MVIWIIGRSGSGKTFFAKNLKKLLKSYKTIHVDGDEVRRYFYNNKLGFSIKDREKNSLFIINLCKFLEKKSFVVICSVQSIFTNHQKLKRKKFNSYYQIFIDVNFDRLKKRNNKKIYSKKHNVVGRDIEFPTPYKSHYVFKNNFDNSYKEHLNTIYKLLKPKMKFLK